MVGRRSRWWRRSFIATHTQRKKQQQQRQPSPCVPSPERPSLVPPPLDQAQHPPFPFFLSSLAPFLELGLYSAFVECAGLQSSGSVFLGVRHGRGAGVVRQRTPYSGRVERDGSRGDLFTGG